VTLKLAETSVVQSRSRLVIRRFFSTSERFASRFF